MRVSVDISVDSGDVSMDKPVGRSVGVSVGASVCVVMGDYADVSMGDHGLPWFAVGAAVELAVELAVKIALASAVRLHGVPLLAAAFRGSPWKVCGSSWSVCGAPAKGHKIYIPPYSY